MKRKTLKVLAVLMFVLVVTSVASFAQILSQPDVESGQTEVTKTLDQGLPNITHKCIDKVISLSRLYLYDYDVPQLCITVTNKSTTTTNYIDVNFEVYAENKWQDLGLYQFTGLEAKETYDLHYVIPNDKELLFRKSTKVRAVLTSPSSYSNEKIVKTVAIDPYKPYLVADSTWVDNWNTYTLKFKVKNKGDFDAGEFALKLDALVNNKWVPFDTVNISGLDAGASDTFTVKYQGKPEKESILLNATMIRTMIDPENNVCVDSVRKNVLESQIGAPNQVKDRYKWKQK